MKVPNTPHIAGTFFINDLTGVGISFLNGGQGQQNGKLFSITKFDPRSLENE